MKFSQAKIKRVFIVKLEDKEKLPDVIENFAKRHKIYRAICIMLGGVGGGKLVCGPEKPNVFPVSPILKNISGTSEILGLGTIFPDEKNNPKLHMHAATGRKNKTLVGCIRPGINVWKIMEFIIFEISSETKAKRKKDKKLGFSVLEP
ncbi:MAG: DNA-binding protein [Candidatus Omnitrophica bacterium]|nr:DNA-binding protein [Candidatus Omnitrophota bacterium]MCM8816300.1 DNA-binding protein [Candidatus Omnitrophota bacterium]